ncbi:MAG: hypothetical protein KF914_12115 [Rhizobiaceae bacterium]|nr:hypothetical protein [Rhizobiaceae bacterium]
MATGKVLRVALLFGSVAIAIALIATAVLDNSLGDRFARAEYGIDRTATGSIGSIGYNGTYIMRRSVLQSSPDAVCILRDNGTRSGEC